MNSDLVQELRQWCEAYPEDVFPTPPDDNRAKDSAAADVMRTMALPMFARCADEIEKLREALTAIATMDPTGPAAGSYQVDTIRDATVIATAALEADR